MYGAKFEFPKGRGGANKKTFHGGGGRGEEGGGGQGRGRDIDIF